MLLSLAGIGIPAGLMLRLAIYALLAGVVGLPVGLAAYHPGAGPIGGFVIGLDAGTMLLALGIVVVESTRVPSLRIVVAAIFAAPAALASYRLLTARDRRSRRVVARDHRFRGRVGDRRTRLGVP